MQKNIAASDIRLSPVVSQLFGELIRNIECLPVDQSPKISRTKDNDLKGVNSELSDTSETDKVSVGNKMIAYISEKANRILETITEIAEHVGYTTDN